MLLSYRKSVRAKYTAAADMLVVGFYFLNRLGEHCKTDKYNTPFTLQDLQFYLHDQPLCLFTSTEAQL